MGGGWVTPADTAGRREAGSAVGCGGGCPSPWAPPAPSAAAGSRWWAPCGSRRVAAAASAGSASAAV